jgi:hypothetical protein
MSDPYLLYEARLGGGLNVVDYPEVLEETAAQVFQNWRFDGAGYVTPRRAIRAMAGSFTGELIGVFPYSGLAGVGAVVLTWNSGTSLINLYTLDTSGAITGTAPRGQLAGWTSVGTKPKVTAAVLNRVLFIADEAKSYGLTCYDPNNVLGSGSTFFQPKFKFVGGTAMALKCRGVAEHANMLLVWGFGTESDADRPEYLRWSYIGLDADAGGAGDAGDVATTGSDGLFDMEDAAMVGARGLPIVAIASGNGRSVIATTDRAFAFYGTDRNSFQLDEIDPQRGCLATRAMVEANGSVYWMSPLGPCRYTGGSEVEDLAYRIKPLLDEIDTTTLFAVHAFNENQVRWHWGSDMLAYDYRRNEFIRGELGVTLFCGGEVRTTGAEAPAGPPSSLAATSITNNSVVPTWLNGDTSAGCTTTVQIDTVNTFNSASLRSNQVGSGIASTTFAGLQPSTVYYLRAKHTRNGSDSSWAATINFTTLAASVVAPPQDFTATDSPVFTPGKGYSESVLLTWDMGETGCDYEIYRSTSSGFTPGPSNLLFTTLVDATSQRDNGVTASTTYYYRARAHKAGNYSSYAAQVSVTPTIP